jgi:hypothetical protein
VTVEHVHVHAGGQAVVGVIGTPGEGERAKRKEQPNAKQIAHAPEPALPCPNSEGNILPITCDEERAVPHARRQITGRTERE